MEQVLGAEAEDAVQTDAFEARAGRTAQDAAAKVEGGNRKAAVQLLLAVGASTSDEEGSTPTACCCW